MSELSYTISRFERKPGSYVRDKGLWCASVDVEGHTLSFTRYDDETEWYCDAHVGKNGFPYFCHGQGSRCCRKQVAVEALKDLLDERLRWEVQGCNA